MTTRRSDESVELSINPLDLSTRIRRKESSLFTSRRLQAQRRQHPSRST